MSQVETRAPKELNMSTIESPVDIDLGLKVDVDPEGRADSATMLRWCVTPELIELLKNQNVTNPYVLIVIGRIRDYGYGAEMAYEQRLLVPLQQEAEFVEFVCRDTNTVMATIVHGDTPEQIARLHRDLLDKPRRNGSYENSVFDYDSPLKFRDLYETYQISSVGVETRLDVVVPDEMFAKEPSKALVNMLRLFGVGSKGPNDCGRRKRWGLWLLSPLAILFHTLVKSVAGFGFAMFGIRSVKWRKLFNPLATSAQFWRDVDIRPVSKTCSPGGGSIFWTNKRGRSKYDIDDLDKPSDAVRLFATATIFPPFVLVGVVALAVLDHGNTWNLPLEFYLLAPLVVPAFMLALLGLALIMFGIATAFGFLKDSTGDFFSWVGKSRRERDPNFKTIDKEALFKELELLSCETNKALPARLDALPKQHRTIHLRWRNLKARVCKPYARG